MDKKSTFKRPEKSKSKLAVEKTESSLRSGIINILNTLYNGNSNSWNIDYYKSKTLQFMIMNATTFKYESIKAFSKC